MDFEKFTETLEVSEKFEETSDSFSLSFKIPDHLKNKFHYDAGQFITLFFKLNGEEVRRSYSLSSSPDWDQDFKISVKRVPRGLISNHLGDNVDIGTRLQVTPPAGRFVLPKSLSNDSLVFFAAGSGITPIISLIKSALKRNSKTKVYLLYCNRDERTIMFHRDLSDINADFHDRFHYEYVLSQPVKPWNGIVGRISSSIVKEFLSRHKIPMNTLSYMCGPEGFMAVVEDGLTQVGYASTSITKESFTTTIHAAPATATNYVAPADSYLEEIGPDAVLIGDKTKAAKPISLSVKLGGENISVPAKEGQSVLETLLESGYNPPYSCMDGACMACFAKVKKGLVYQNDMGILTEDNTEMGECLTCQAKPGSETVEIDYDV